MTALDLLLVVVGGAAGAVSRHLLVGWSRARLGATPAGGTVLVNLLGSFALGVVAAVVAGGGPAWLLTAVGVGYCGALTTFGSHAVQVAAGLRSGDRRGPVADVVISLLGCLAAVTLGWSLGSLL